MKQLLFLFLFPYLAVAQYTGNSGQKITLGEQTTADGLVFRGVASIDTVTATSKITRANKQDTSAFILLDTVTNLLWHYKIGSNGWIQAGGGVSVSSFSAGSTGLTPSTATTGAVTLGGTLAVANGGTNRTTMPAGYILHGDATSVDTAIGLFWNRNARKLGVGTNTPNGTLDVIGIITSNAGGVQFPREFRNDFTPTFERADLFFLSNFTSNNGFRWGTIADAGGTTFQGTAATNSGIKANINFNPDGGNIGIGLTGPTEKLHVDGNARITAMNGINDIGASATGVLQAATSDINLKNTIENSPFGLNEILLLNPVTFLYNDENRKIDSDVKEVGFIAQDVFDIIPNAVSSTGAGELQLDYRAITATLVKAIQEQNALIKTLEQRILIFENK